MRYAQGGGLTDERRIVREMLRMEAAERFRQGDENPVIAHDLRVSVRSVQRWRRAWSQNGPRALASKGPASLPLLSDELFAVLARELAKGPVAHGWPNTQTGSGTVDSDHDGSAPSAPSKPSWARPRTTKTERGAGYRTAGTLLGHPAVASAERTGPRSIGSTPPVTGRGGDGQQVVPGAL
ncbi:Transposase [Streptomyces hygroscopicus subsp. limoneus]|nr:Transposase [Streptomyces hygroscopicus subsp. limoneus]